MSRQKFECADVLNTEEGLLSCIQMSSTGCVMCCSGAIWPGEKQFLCLAVLVLSAL